MNEWMSGESMNFHIPTRVCECMDSLQRERLHISRPHPLPRHQFRSDVLWGPRLVSMVPQRVGSSALVIVHVPDIGGRSFKYHL